METSKSFIYKNSSLSQGDIVYCHRFDAQNKLFRVGKFEKNQIFGAQIGKDCNIFGYFGVNGYGDAYKYIYFSPNGFQFKTRFEKGSFFSIEKNKEKLPRIIFTSGLQMTINYNEKKLVLYYEDRSQVIYCEYLKRFDFPTKYVNYFQLNKIDINSDNSVKFNDEIVDLHYKCDDWNLYFSKENSSDLKSIMHNPNTNESQIILCDMNSPTLITGEYIFTVRDGYIFYGKDNGEYNYGIKTPVLKSQGLYYEILLQDRTIKVFDDGRLQIFQGKKQVFSLEYDDVKRFILNIKNDDIKKITNNVFRHNIVSNSNIDAEKELEELVGLYGVKNQIRRFKKYCLNAIANGNPINLHMVFSGNPGTGKTTVARLVGKILYKYKILPTDKFIECSKETLVGQYIGHTALKTLAVVKEAMGGVMFIDEAYSLSPTSSHGFEGEAIATLIRAMEENKGKFCVILAGYSNEMAKLFDVNSGLKSRIQKDVFFEDYSRDELAMILDLHLKKVDYKISSEAKEQILDYVIAKQVDKNYANAREIRIAIEQLCMIQAERTIENLDDKVISNEDVKIFIEENVEKKQKKKDINCSMIKYEDLANYSRKILNFDSNKIDILESVIAITQYESNGKSEGTGFIISPEGYAITCAHVIDNSESIVARRRIKDRRGNWVETYHQCFIAGIDKDNDIAIIKLGNDYNAKFSYLSLEMEKEANPLDEIVEIGYPLGQSSFDNVSIFHGYISSIQNIMGFNKYLIDIKACPGSSGSCLIDKKTCKVIGIVQGMYHRDGYRLNFAIMATQIIKLIKESNKKE